MKKRIIALGMVLVIALTACSDGGGDDTGDTTGETTVTTAAP